MVKAVKVYETSDGKQYKTKASAEKYEIKLESQKTMERLGMTSEEISAAIKKTSEYNKNLRMIANLHVTKPWYQWPIHHQRLLNKNVFAEPEKKTIFVRLYKDWGTVKEQELFVDTGSEFSSEDKYCENGSESYKVVEVEKINDFQMKVIYDYKYSWEERLKMKLEAGEKLSEKEIRDMTYNLEEIHEEEGEDGRWERPVTTVVDLLGDHYAINWMKGLTESQENSFYEQPYKVKVESKEVTITQVFITPI